MGLVFVVGLSVVMVWLTIAVVTAPRWVARSFHRHRLWGLRDDFVSQIIDGALPGEHPAVRQVHARIERSIEQCFKITLVGGVLFIQLARRAPADAVEALRRDNADRPTGGLTDDQVGILRAFDQSLRVLQVGTLLLGSWFGVTVVLVHFVGAAFKRGLSAVQIEKASFRRLLSNATDEVATSTTIGRTAGRVVDAVAVGVPN